MIQIHPYKNYTWFTLKNVSLEDLSIVKDYAKNNKLHILTNMYDINREYIKKISGYKLFSNKIVTIKD